MRTGTLVDNEFKTKTDFLSGSQSKASHGQPNGQSVFKKLFRASQILVSYAKNDPPGMGMLDTLF